MRRWDKPQRTLAEAAGYGAPIPELACIHVVRCFSKHSQRNEETNRNEPLLKLRATNEMTRNAYSESAEGLDTFFAAFFFTVFLAAFFAGAFLAVFLAVFLADFLAAFFTGAFFGASGFGSGFASGLLSACDF